MALALRACLVAYVADLAFPFRVGHFDLHAVLRVWECLAFARDDFEAREARLAVGPDGLSGFAVFDWFGRAVQTHVLQRGDRVARLALQAHLAGLFGAVRDQFRRAERAVGREVVLRHDVEERRTRDRRAVAEGVARGEHVRGAQVALLAGGVRARLPVDVLGGRFVVLLGLFLLFFDLFVLEFAGSVAHEFVARVAEFAGIELGVLCTVVAVVGVFGHFALGFFVVRHVVGEAGREAVDLDALELRLRVELPALLEVARVAPVASPGVLHDPEADAVLVVAPAHARDRVPARVALARLRLLDFGPDRVHVLVDRHADDHRAVALDVRLDLGCLRESQDFASLAAAAHFFGLEGRSVLQSAPVCVRVVRSTAVAIAVRGRRVDAG